MDSTHNLLGYLHATQLEIERRQQAIHNEARKLEGRMIEWDYGGHVQRGKVICIGGFAGCTRFLVKNTRTGAEYWINLSRVLTCYSRKERDAR